jgi:Secretion system C-terminal sorting domain/SdrD B-like domain
MPYNLKILPFSIPLLFSFLAGNAQLWDWGKKISTPDSTTITRALETIDLQGNIIVLSGTNNLTGAPNAPQWNKLFLLTKYDYKGLKLWEKTMSYDSVPSIHNLTVDSAGNIYTFTSRYNAINGANITGPTAPNYLSKFDQLGERIWARSLGRVQDTTALTWMGTDGQNVFIGASFPGSLVQILDTLLVFPSSSNLRPVVVGIDSSGTRLWHRIFLDSIGEVRSLGFNMNSKKEIVFSGYYSGKIKADTFNIIRPFNGDFRFFSMIDGNTGRVKWLKHGYNTVGILGSHPILISDSSSVYTPQIHLDTLTFNGIKYFTGLYMETRNKDGSVRGYKPIDNSSTWKGLNKQGNNFYAAVSHVSPEYEAIEKYDTSWNLKWRAIIPTNGFVKTESVTSKNDVVVTSGSFSATAYFGPDTLQGNGVRRGFVAVIRDGINSISGKVFLDLNKNGIADAGDPPLKGGLISTSSSRYITATDNEGRYEFFVDTAGTYIYTLSNPPLLFTPVPLSHTSTFNAAGQSDVKKDFALQAPVTVNDVEIDVVPLATARPGFSLRFSVTILNKGTSLLSGTYSMKFDPNIIFHNSDTVFTLVSADSIVWNYTGLKPLTKISNIVNCTLKATTPINTILKSTAYVLPILGDSTPANNMDSVQILVRGSFDPNDKLVYPLADLNLDTAKAEKRFLEYTIRFQNTGTDTAFNVRILDSLSPKLNWRTFELITSSHPVEFIPLDSARFQFYFPNILLPDSNINEPKSHGFVKFRIKPRNSIQLSDTILNSAGIYFDYNVRIVTNNTKTAFRVEVVTGINDPVNYSKYLKLYPNPADQNVLFEIQKVTAGNYTLRIYDLLGRVVYNTNVNINGQGLRGTVKTAFLSKGVYIVEISGKNTLARRKLIKL